MVYVLIFVIAIYGFTMLLGVTGDKFLHIAQVVMIRDNEKERRDMDNFKMAVENEKLRLLLNDKKEQVKAEAKKQIVEEYLSKGQLPPPSIKLGIG